MQTTPLFRYGATLLMLVTAAPAGAAEYKQVETLLETDRSIIGEPLHYPGGAPAKISAKVVTIAPGEETAWHKHGVPLYAYLLAGTLVVDYGEKGTRTYHPGDSFMEAMDQWHHGTNPGTEPVRILAVYLGGNDQPLVIGKKPQE